jgi:CRP-like cAMP-binding protein
MRRLQPSPPASNGIRQFDTIATMLRKDAKIELLKNVPLFSQCNKKQLASIASLADLISVPAGTQLITEGRPGLEFMVIVEGGGEVRRKGRKIDTLAPGDFIGEMALITGGPRNATVRTTTDTSLLAVTGRQFWTLLEQAPGIQTSLLKAMGQRLQALGV